MIGEVPVGIRLIRVVCLESEVLGGHWRSHAHNWD